MSPTAPTARARTFLLVTIAGSLVSWDIGFEFGAFETVSYHRVFAIFVVSTVVLIATVLADDDTFATSWPSRLALSVPLLYLLTDVVFLRVPDWAVDIFAVAVFATLPYSLWVAAQVLGSDYFTLPHSHKAIAALVVLLIAVAGFYVGDNHQRFLLCSDFERIGDYTPPDCQP